MDIDTEEPEIAGLRSAFDERLTMDLEEEKKPAGMDAMVAKLKSNLSITSFTQLACVIQYSGFVKDLETCNGPLASNMRRVVDVAWLRLLDQEFAKWNSTHTSEDDLTKETQLAQATSQVDSSDATLFWSRKAALEHLPGHRAIPARWGYGTKSGRKLGKTTIGDNGIILPVMKNGFRSLAYGLKFKGFVAHLEELNGPTIQRGVAETEFKKLLNELFLEYAADTKYKSEDKDKDLKEALDQIKGYGKFHPDKYWESDSPNAVRIRKDQAKFESKWLRKYDRVVEERNTKTRVQPERKAKAKKEATVGKKKAARGARVEKPGFKKDYITRSVWKKPMSKQAMWALEDLVSQMGIKDEEKGADDEDKML